MSSTLFPGGRSVSLFSRASFTSFSNGNGADLDEYAYKQITALSKKLATRYIESKKGGAGIPLREAFESKDIDDQLAKIEENPNALNFEEVIDNKGEAGVYYQVQEMIKAHSFPLNTTRLLANRYIAAYLFARAKYMLDLDDAASIYKYMTNDDNGGIKVIYDYIIRESAKNIILKEKLELGKHPDTGEDYTPDEFVQLLNLGKHKISFAKGIFSAKVKTIITNRIFNGEKLDIIEGLKDTLKIEDADIPALLAYMKNSKIEIDANNAEFYLSHALAELKNNSVSYSSTTTTAADESDFAVQYYDDDKTTLSFNKESVLCAAQMYYVMTLGDELDIFNTVNTIITKYLPSGQVDITSKEALNDLQLYVFNESFRDLKDGTEYKRTEPEERRMFYRQVFSAGSSETVEGMALNEDFNILWATLMEETVKYISKVEKSENPELFVSRQPIFQVIEDLRYNLSLHCTGMAKVAAPIINKELDFVIQRILMNEEIRKQLAPNGGSSFWRVIENVQRASNNEIPNVAALRNKAVFGHQIITTIANYTPESLDTDNAFGKFISTVEAYIIANSQLENNAERNSLWGEEEAPEKADKPELADVGEKDDWDF